MIVLMLVYNVMYVIGTIAQYYVDLNRDKNKRAHLSWGYTGIISISTGDLCFNIAHWILAMFYLRLAKNMPRVYYNEIPKPYNTVFWTGMVYSVFGPILEIVCGMWFYTMFIHREYDPNYTYNEVVYKMVSYGATLS